MKKKQGGSSVGNRDAELTYETAAPSIKRRRADSGNSSVRRIEPTPNTLADGSDVGLSTDLFASTICDQIRSIHRERESAKKIRVKVTNSIAATIMSELGYSAALSEDERGKFRKRADRLIKAVLKGKEVSEDDQAVAARFAVLIGLTGQAIAPIVGYEKLLEGKMFDLASQLPIAEWINKNRGVDFVQLAMIIGETGDLANYSTVAKVWKRLGLLPFQGRMPKQWAIRGGLTKEQWTQIGYNPRRRSIMHVCSKSLMMLNDGVFRDRYDVSKAKAKESHPDWRPCHLDQHALLCTAKCFIKHLWCQWNNRPAC